MSQLTAPAAVGFPPPLLGNSPKRLFVVATGGGALALEKPAGVTGSALTAALHRQLADGKPELARFNLGAHPVCVWTLDAELAGLLLFTAAGNAATRWRNAYGSDQIEFVFEFLAANTPDVSADDHFECALPVALHRSKPLALISRTTGKKALTRFRRLARAGAWSWWEAATRFPRFHQIRLHAAECGLRIAGETLYADGGAVPPEALAGGRRPNKGEMKPAHDGIVLRLARVECADAINAFAAAATTDAAAKDDAGLGAATLLAPVPPKWAVLRKRLN